MKPIGNKEHRCPECKSSNVSIYPSFAPFQSYMKCNNCGHTRGGFSDWDALISIWDKEYEEAIKD